MPFGWAVGKTVVDFVGPKICGLFTFFLLCAEAKNTKHNGVHNDVPKWEPAHFAGLSAAQLLIASVMVVPLLAAAVAN